MSEIDNLHAEWTATFKLMSEQRVKHEKERQPLADELEAFEKNKPVGMLGKLKHAMTLTVGMAPLREKIGEIDDKISTAKYGITKAAKETYNALASLAMGSAENADLRARYNKQGRTMDILTTAAQDVEATIAKCQASIKAEYFDVQSTSKEASLHSWQATKAARASIKATKVALKTAKDQLQGMTDVDSSGVDGLQTNFSFEIGIDSIDSPARPSGDQINWWNMQEMQSAVTQLNAVYQTLNASISKVDGLRQSIIGQAIGRLRDEDPAADKLAAAISPHLPGNLASNMQSRPKPKDDGNDDGGTWGFAKPKPPAR